MIVRPNENRKQTILNNTVNGIYVSASLLASAANALLLKTQYGTGLGFDASAVQVQVILKKDGRTFPIFNDNLGILGQYNAILSGGKNWIVGTDYVRPGVGVKHSNVRTVFLHFGGHVNVKADDELEININCGKGAFSAASLDIGSCFLDVNPAYSIGKQVGIFSTYTKIIQANSTREQFNLGDNVTKMAFLNFEDTDVTSAIIQTCGVSSDRYDQSMNLADLINRHNTMFGKQPYNLPYANTAISGILDTYVSAFPQSFVILNDEEIDQASIDLTFDGSKVHASMNVLVYTNFVSSQEMISAAVRMEQKHSNENISKLPTTLV